MSNQSRRLKRKTFLQNRRKKANKHASRRKAEKKQERLALATYKSKRGSLYSIKDV